MSDFTFLNIHRVVNEDQDNGLDTVFYPVTDKRNCFFRSGNTK